MATTPSQTTSTLTTRTSISTEIIIVWPEVTAERTIRVTSTIAPESTGTRVTSDRSLEQATSTGNALSTTMSSPTETRPAVTAAAGAGQRSSISRNASIGIGVGLALGVILVILLIAWFFSFRKSKKNKDSESAEMEIRAQVTNYRRQGSTAKDHMSTTERSLLAISREQSQRKSRKQSQSQTESTTPQNKRSLSKSSRTNTDTLPVPGRPRTVDEMRGGSQGLGLEGAGLDRDERRPRTHDEMRGVDRYSEHFGLPPPGTALSLDLDRAQMRPNAPTSEDGAGHVPDWDGQMRRHGFF